MKEALTSTGLTLRNRRGITIGLHPLGATWTSCRLPLPDQVREVLLGSRDVVSMLLEGGSYLGASVGRYAGRIAQARFGDNVLDANQPPHILHGGRQGLARQLWTLDSADAHQATFRIFSPAGDQGFPGNLNATAQYRLDDDDSLTIVYSATTDAPTPCNFTNHAYFNLNGGDGDDGLAQVLQIHADRYQPVGTDGIPDAAPRAVEGTGFDFRQPKRLDADFLRDVDQQKVKGYDHSFLLGEAPSDASTGAALQLAAELCSADGRVSLQVHTDQPALHLYTGQYLGGTEKRDGSHYADLAGVALESQFPPDSPSHGRAILLPGQTYRRTTRFDFRF